MTELVIPVDPKYFKAVQEDAAKMKLLVDCATDFRKFLEIWYFQNGETGQVIKLGDDLWDGQESFIQCMKDHDFIFALKARKLGFTTLGIAYDAWVVRFRDVNARVHLFSRREKAAQSLLKGVIFGLNRLPEWMQLPKHATANELEVFAGPNDTRRAVAYPADEDTAVEDTATHGHVDEWARMRNPERVWQAVEPSMAHTCHIITTGMGPNNYPARFWRQSEAGDTSCHAFFVGALSRSGRDRAWMDKKKSSMTDSAYHLEYAETPADALYGGGAFTFKMEFLDVCNKGVGPEPAQLGHNYSVAWDIGRHKDAAVGIVIDLSVSPNQVVDYARLRGVPYPMTQARIEKQWSDYGLTPRSRLQVEKNGPGEAVLENLHLPIKVIENAKFNTSQSSKARIISNLEIAFQNSTLHYDAVAWPQLDTELRGYQVPDDYVVQDSVLALGICYDEVLGGNTKRGKAHKVVTW